MKKVLFLLFACVFLSAQMPMIPGFPPGTFQNRAAIDAPMPPSSGMRTPIMADNGQTGPSTTSTQYMGVNGSATPWSASVTNRDQPWAKSGTWKNLVVRFPVALTQGTYDITLMVNGVATALTCQITTASTTCSDSVNTAYSNPNDTVAWRSVATNVGGAPNAQTQVQISAVFQSDGPDSVIGIPFTVNPSNSAVNYTVLGQTSGSTQWTATESIAQGIIPTAGTIDNLTIKHATASGAGTDYTYRVRLNGADVGSACTISGASATTCTAAISTAVVAGDLVAISSTPTGTPTASPVPRMSIGWTPTTVGEAMQINALTTLSGGVTRYLSYEGSSAGNNTETNVQSLAPCAFTAKFLRASMTTGSATGTRDHTMRKAAVNQSLSCTFASATSASCTDSSNTVSVATSDLIDWASITTLGSVTTSYKYSSVMLSCTP